MSNPEVLSPHPRQDFFSYWHFQSSHGISLGHSFLGLVMNILFAVLAMVYAAIGVTTVLAPLVSTVFFCLFGFAIYKALTFKAPTLVRSKRSYSK